MIGESGRPHRKLEVWQKSMVLVKTIYELTGEFPKEETYGLSSQMQRSAVSIPSNIAEGAARKSKAEFLQFFEHCSRLTERAGHAIRSCPYAWLHRRREAEGNAR